MCIFVYKRSAITIAILSVLILMACGKKSDPPTTTSTEDPPVPTYNLAWQTIGIGDFSDNAASISLKVYDGTPYVAYKNTSDSNKVYVEKYDVNLGWIDVSGALSPTAVNSDAVAYVKMDIDSLGNVFVVYNLAALGTIKVIKFNGTAWSEIPGFADTTTYTPAIAIYSGKPCIAYIDSSTRVAAKAYNGTNWIAVSMATAYTATDYISIYVNESLTTGYIAFRDSANSNKASALIYTLGSGSASLIGTAGFSDNAASYINISVDSDDVPYVSYRDDTLLKAFVMKYNSGSGTWSKIGTSGLSTGDAEALSMHIYNKTLAVCYQDETSSDKVSAKISDGTSWFNFGIQGFSDNAVTETSIFVDSAESYVAYIDKTTNKITVKKY